MQKNAILEGAKKGAKRCQMAPFSEGANLAPSEKGVIWHL